MDMILYRNLGKKLGKVQHTCYFAPDYTLSEEMRPAKWILLCCSNLSAMESGGSITVRSSLDNSHGFGISSLLGNVSRQQDMAEKIKQLP